jgi:hypothetical protein
LILKGSLRGASPAIQPQNTGVPLCNCNSDIAWAPERPPEGATRP